MNQTMKRMLALVMALMLALPTFALADVDEAYVPLPEETVGETELPLGVDPDIVDIVTGDPDEEDDGDGEMPEEGFDEAEALPEGCVRVSVAVTPAEAFVAIYAAADALAPEGEPAAIEPQLGADWLLTPGVYEYSAWAEGYVPAERVAFEVPAQEEPFELVIALEKAAEEETEVALTDAPEADENQTEVLSENTEESNEQTEVGNEDNPEEIIDNADHTDIDSADEATPSAAVDDEDEETEAVTDDAEPSTQEEGAEENDEYDDISDEIIEETQEEAELPEDAEAEEAPEEIEEADEGVDLADAQESAEVPFEQSLTVDGVVVTVTAQPGAFPADAALSVTKVRARQQAEANAAVEEARDDDANVAESYTFDIKVLDADGNELQPAEGFTVSVSFALARVADQNLETSVYHITEDASGELTADRLDAVEDTGAETVTAETDGFSLYTVEFTYNTLQYVLEGGESVALNDILSAVGLVGEAEGASVSNEALFSVSDETGEWLLTSHAPFTTEEWLRVTVGGVAYEITVTDDGAVSTFYTVNEKNENVTATAVTATNTPLNANTSKWYVVNGDVELSERLAIVGDVNLILADGKTLTANKGIRLSRGNSLTIYAQSSGTGKLIVPKNELTIGQAAIGGNVQENAGAFTLYGGEVTVEGGSDGAGIGGGDSGAGGAVTVFGGTLNVTGGKYAAGIGGGLSGSQYGPVTIWGGKVTVTGGDYGAGIGGGENFNDEFGNTEYGGNGGQVSVWGGKLTVTGGRCAAAIGGGQFGSGGQLQVGGEAQITATAGAKSKRDKVGIQAIGRGELSTSESREGDKAQTEGTVVFAGGVTVTAGESAESATQCSDYDRLDGCRKPYVRIGASGTLSYVIDKQINQVLDDRQTDKIDVKDMSGKSIAMAKPGEQFRVEVSLVKSELKSLTVSYTVGGVQHTDTLDPTGTGNLLTSTYTMPQAVDGVVTVRAEVERKKYEVKWTYAVPHGKVSVQVDSNIYTNDGSVMVSDGTKVHLFTEPNDGEPDYFIQAIYVKDAENGRIYASLVNDDKTDIAEGSVKDKEWIFTMPERNVVITTNFAEGCHFIDTDGTRRVRHYFHVIQPGANLNMNGEGSEAGWYVVRDTVNISNRVNVTSDVNLILCDGATFNANDGIFVAKRLNARLTIWAQSNGTGKLNADATGTNWAGIGGNKEDDTGPITINGGKITATGGEYAAGISGGQYSETDTVIINEPKSKSLGFTTVTATGGKYGAGIGGGEDRNNDNTVINGGKVYAYGGSHGAGIGGGEGGGNNKIEINGGYVYAEGGELAAGLGGGEAYRGGGFGGTVEINGGDVWAYGGRNGAGVGGGEDGDPSTVTVNGGELYAKGGEYAAGIGGGENKPGGTFTIYDGDVTAYGGKNAAGIGGAEDEKGGTVYIHGGVVLAGSSGDVNCAIGGGKGEGNNGTLVIDDGMCVRGDNDWDTCQTMDPVLYGERVGYCFYRRYARIKPCDHPNGGGGYEPIDDNQHRVKACVYCASTEKQEDHVWDAAGVKCLRCGYSRIRNLYIPNADKLLIEVTAGDKTIYGYGDGSNEWWGRIIQGQSVTVKVTPRGAYEIDGSVDASGIDITNEEVDTETGAHTLSFTMPMGNVQLYFNVIKRDFQAHLIYRENMGSTWFSGKVTTKSCWAGETLYVFAQPRNENYNIREVNVYKRNPDGTNGDPVEIEHDINKSYTPSSGQRIEAYKVTVPTSSLNVVVTFGRAGRAEVYHVLQTFDQETGAPIWPTTAPDPLSKEAVGTYWANWYPDDEVLEDQDLSYKYFLCYGYSFTYNSKIQPLEHSYGTISIPEDEESLYVYYKRRVATLNVCQADGKTIVHTFDNVPVGTPLLAYIQNEKHLDPGKTSDNTPMQWATKSTTPGSIGSFTLLTSDTTMPEDGITVYPVDPRQYAHVLLAVDTYVRTSVYDWNVYNGNASVGGFWGNSWKDRNSAYMWSDIYSEPTSKTEWAYMDAGVDRSYRLQLGEALPANVVTAMQNVTRPGYKLVGWKVIKEHEEQLIDLDDFVADENYYYSTTRTYTSGAYNGRKYGYIRLQAVWELRDALIIYDAADGAFSDGSRYKTQVISGNSDQTRSLLSNAPTKNDGGWRFDRWVLPVRDKAYYFAGDTLNYDRSSLVSTSSRLVADDDIANSSDPDAKNIIRFNATYTERGNGTCSIRFRKEDDSIHAVASISIPSGEGKVRFSATRSGDVTRVINAAGAQLVREFDNPTREGYTFLGWREEFSEEVQQSLDITAYRSQKGRGDATVDIYACWKENPHKLILNLDGGSWSSDSSVQLSYDYGETIPWNKLVPARQHYDFAGWTLEDGSAVPATMPHADVKARARWKPHEYTMTFIVTGSEPYYIRGVKGKDIKELLPLDPVDRKGLKFNGWYPENPPKTMPGEDTTFIAKWLIVPDKPDPPELEAVDLTTVGVVDPDETQVYSIDGGKTWVKPEQKEISEEVTVKNEQGEYERKKQTVTRLAVLFEGLTPGQTYSVITKVTELEGVRVESEVSDPASITLPKAVRVRLDLGGYDYVAATDKTEEHVAKLNLWDGYPLHDDDTKTPVDLPWGQARQFYKTEGDAIVLERLASATRVGYTLAGWYNKNNARLTVTQPIQAVALNYDDDVEHPGTLEDPYPITLTARWTLRNASVEYKVNSDWEGTAPQGELNLAFGDTAAITDAKPKADAGKYFSHWTIGETGRAYYPGGSLVYDSADMVTAFGNVDAEGNPVNNTITLTPVFANKPAVDVDLAFNSQGGSYVAPVRVTVPAGQESVEVEVTVSTDVEHKTTVQYKDRTIIQSNIAAPTREGYDFKGWSAAENGEAGTQTLTFDRGANNKKTVYAVWDANPHTVTFYANGVVYAKKENVKYASAIPTPANPTRQYYTFAGWSPALPQTMPDEDLTVYADWTPKEYTIKFDTGGGIEISDIKAPYGARLTLPADPTRENYVFQGWKKEDTGVLVPLPMTMPGGGATYVASWLAKKKTPDRPEVKAKTHDSITIKVKRGQKYAIVAENADVPTPDNADLWDSWNETSHTFTAIVNDIGLIPGHTYKLYTFIPGDTTQGEADSDVSPATVVTLPHVLEVRLDLGGYDYVAAETTDKDSLHLWWNTDPYSDRETAVHLDAGQWRSFPKDENDTIELKWLSGATRDGYTLDGWFTQNGTRLLTTLGATSDYYDNDESGNPVGEGTKAKPYIITLTARWTPRTADIVYDATSWEPAAPTTSPVAYGASATITNAVPVAPAGQNFAYWKNEKTQQVYYSNDDLLYNTIDMVTGIGTGVETNNNSITLTAVYVPKPAATGTLNFDSKGGSTVASYDAQIASGEETVMVKLIASSNNKFTVICNNVTTEYDVPTKLGYKFDGWYQDEDCNTTAMNVDLTVNRDIPTKVYAKWTINQYTITFDTQGGSEISPIKQNFDTTITAPAAPTRDHHNFMGWSPALPAKMPARDLTLTAVWKQTVYTISFFYDDQTEYEDLRISGIYGTKITPPKAYREGEIFKGWYSQQSNPDNRIETLPPTMPGENLTYYAVWKANNSEIPDRPSAKAIDSTTIQVNEPSFELEYSYKKKDDPDTAWSEWRSPVSGKDASAAVNMTFTGLQPDTEYEVRARYAETDDMKPSGPSESCTVHTAPNAPKLSPGVGSLTVEEPNPALEYQCVDAAKMAHRGTIDEPWVSPSDGKMVFDNLEERHMYYVRARYKTAGNDAAPSSWTAEQTHKTTITDARIEGEPLVGNTLKTDIDPEKMRDDVYYLWMVDGEIVSVQSLSDKLDYFEEFQDIFRVAVVQTPSYKLTAEDAGRTIQLAAWQFDVPNWLGLQICLSEELEVRRETLLTGVSIEGERFVGETLRAVVQPGNVQSLSYQWTRNGRPIPGATGARYALVEADADATIGVTVVQDVKYEDDVTRSASVLVKKRPGGAAQTPVLLSRAPDSLTVQTRPGEEYSIDGGKTWQSGGAFTGLDPARTYNIVARMAETGSTYVGAVSAPLAATTDKWPGNAVEGLTSTPASSANAGDGAIHGVAPGMEYSEDGGRTWLPVTGESLDGLVPGDYLVRWAEDATHYAGPAASVAVKVTALDTSAMLIATMHATGNRSLNATWTRVPGADGYDVFFINCGTYTFKYMGTVAGNAERTFDFDGLDAKRGYKVIVKAFVMNGAEKTYVAESPVAHCFTAGGGAKSVNPASLTLKKKALTVKLGKTATIRGSIKGVRRGGTILAHDRKLRFYSSNRAVATVTKSGKVKAVGSGSCLIYVLTSNGIWDTVTVTVDDSPTRVRINRYSRKMKVGEVQILGPRVRLTPAKAVTSLTWTSSNPDVATVDENGNVTAIAKGRTVITVTTHNGKRARIWLTIK